mgnify:CR=1 FL=1
MHYFIFISDEIINFKEHRKAAKKAAEERKREHENYIKAREEEADKYAAKAGFSEHQLGTTLDIANVWTIEEGDPEYKWIDKNGYKYGYIFR